MLVYLPGMQQFDLLLFEVRGNDRDVVLVSLDVFDHGLELVTIDDFGLGYADDVEGGHAKNNCELVIQFPELGTVLILFTQEWNFLLEFELIERKYKKIISIDIK